jgi:hypothetical protein
MRTVDFVAGRRGRFAPAFLDGLFPLFVCRDEIARRGIRMRYLAADGILSRPVGSALCLNSRAFRYVHGRLATDHLALLERLRQRYAFILWFDNRDSAGNTQFEVLPFVDRYCKKQLFRDRRLYRRHLYQNRAFTDYIHREYGLTDALAETPDVPLQDAFAAKLTVSWNLAYADYRSLSRAGRLINIVRASFDPEFCANERRPIDVHARFRTSFSHDTIAFPRTYLMTAVRRLHDVESRTGYTSRAAYRAELRRAGAVLSPFGWGEICLRDFEAMVYGCALVKPSLDHIETWPDVFDENSTYIALPWNLEEAIARLDAVIRDKRLIGSVARAGQAAYRTLWGDGGRQSFVDRLEALLTPVA